MELSPEEIEHLGKLAKLALTDEEKKRYAHELTAIFGLIAQLHEVNTENIEPTCQVTGLEDVYREDEVRACSDEVRQGIIEEFPDKEGDLLKVPGVFE